VLHAPPPSNEKRIHGLCCWWLFIDRSACCCCCLTIDVGGWYEIATSPTSLATFEHDCYCTKAIYTPQPDGTVQVNNTCRISSPTGAVNSAIGTARVPDASQPGKLQVKFGGPFWGPYWVVFIDPSYDVSIVWSCDVVQFMWILSRTPTISDQVYQKLLYIAQMETGYDVSLLVKTVQNGCTY
jgi:lipocalin